MRKVLTLAPILLAALTLLTLPLEAEAKRFGFGKSFGKQYSMPSQKSTPTLPPSTGTQAAGHSVPKSGASRWLGPLAGLAAGGLLAALLFGDTFEGFQIMDFLVFAALVFGGMMLFRAMRGRSPQYQLRSAEGPNLASDFQAAGSEPAENTNVAPNGQSEGAYQSPAWFDSIGFINGAKVHYIRLQAAWDKGDMKDIAEYTTPELFAQLQAERLSHGNTENFTEVVSIDAELVHCQRDGDSVVASVRFSGMIREERDAEPQAFSEIWHVTHSWDSPQGDWFVAGIQQVEGSQ